MVERGNRTIENMLSAFVSKNQKDWDDYIALLMMAYRSSEHQTTEISPYEMVFGRQITLPVDMAMRVPSSNYELTTYKTDYAYKLSGRINKIHEFARDRIKMSSDNMKRTYDRSSQLKIYKENDLVWLYNPVRKKGISPKLQCTWTGPFNIIKKINDVIYKIQKNKKVKPKIVHYDRLKPYISKRIL
ncbi:unnamed protein product [Mytilus coruscus]|uniref:Integrase p58-like C-terminal domain-containing protein n=1 Tax=Mytilus coruscus TaxID=42192 RepID=A0A6J8D8W6_MYTCO|nr:unnamed protein product [Mytilus coruscus]